jgi:hypothetical protein
LWHDTHLTPSCPHADLFNGAGRAWLARQPVPVDECEAIEQHMRKFDRLADDLNASDTEFAPTLSTTPPLRG